MTVILGKYQQKYFDKFNKNIRNTQNNDEILQNLLKNIKIDIYTLKWGVVYEC